MGTTTLRCGRIAYTNDIPVYAAFDAGAVEFPGTQTSGVPARLNAALLAGELDCAPISSFFYAQHPDAFVLLPDVCIGSRRHVRSIHCVSPVELAQLRGTNVAVTKESATGRALFDVICRTRYGFAPAYVEADEPLRAYREHGMACVLIGDAAIDAALAYPDHAHDLGDLWHGLTSEDMVYAVWAVRRDVAERDTASVEAVAAALRASLDWSLEHLDVAIAQAQALIPRAPGFYEDYYQALNFRFDRAAQRGLRAFFGLCERWGLLVEAPQPSFFGRELAGV